MVFNINLDDNSMNEVEELAMALKVSKSKLIRIAIKDLYLKEKRARENLLFFTDLYNEEVIDRGTLFLLLPKADAEAVIIGSRMGKDAAKIAKDFDS